MIQKKIRQITKVFCLILTLLFFIFAQNARGGVDPAFNPALTKDLVSDFNGKFALQPDGKIIIFGTFSGGSFINRLNTDGTPDVSFNCTICSSVSIANPLVKRFEF